jgi:hypothetical protein
MIKVLTNFGPATVVEAPPHTARRRGTHRHKGKDYWIYREGGKLFLVLLVL